METSIGFTISRADLSSHQFPLLKRVDESRKGITTDRGKDLFSGPLQPSEAVAAQFLHDETLAIAKGFTFEYIHLLRERLPNIRYLLAYLDGMNSFGMVLKPAAFAREKVQLSLSGQKPKWWEEGCMEAYKPALLQDHLILGPHVAAIMVDDAVKEAKSLYDQQRWAPDEEWREKPVYSVEQTHKLGAERGKDIYLEVLSTAKQIEDTFSHE